MPRRKRYIRGKIYLIDDKILSRDGYSKSNRRVVALNNDKNRVHIVKIKSLYDSKGNRRKNLIPIEKNSLIKSRVEYIRTYIVKQNGILR